MHTRTPTADRPQHLLALARANEVRLARAELKRRVADGELMVVDVILQAPWESRTMSVSDLLMSQRRWGRTRCRKLLQGIPMSETKTVESMTERQREAVAAVLSRQARDARAAQPSDAGALAAYA